MVDRLETFPYEVLLIWQGLHGPLTDDQVSRFLADPDVRRIGVFHNSLVRQALRQTPSLSEALALARRAQIKSQPVQPIPRSSTEPKPRRQQPQADRQRTLQKRLSAKSRWRKGGYFVRRAQIWADDNRDNPTDAERRLETILRGMFQHIGPLQVQWIFGKPSAPYILDFFLPRVRLGIEVDGSIHNVPEVKARDEHKADMARSIGITMRRFTNDEVLNSSPETIQATVQTWYKQAAQYGLSRRRRPR